MPRSRVWGLTAPDWGIVVGAALVGAGLLVPWLSLAGASLRPVDLLGVWGLMGLLALLVLPLPLAGRLPYTRWFAVIPLVAGCLLLGVVAGVAGAVLAINPLLARLPWQDASEITQTVSRLAGLARLSVTQIDTLDTVVSRFAAEPQLSIRAGIWLFGVSAIVLIVAGYRKIVEYFAEPVSRAEE